MIGLTVLSAIAVVGYVASIDWNQHKDKIAEKFFEVTGKKIVFDGPISMSLLPSPYLNASNVKIYNEGESSDKPLMQINDLVANLALMPLLKGNVDVQRMVLEKPQIYFEMMDDDTLNWQQPLSEEQRQKLESTEIALNSVSLENASLNFVDEAKDINLKLDNLNAEVVAESILGPYRIEGNYVKDNNPEGFAISVGHLSDSFATTLNLVISHPVSKSYLRFDGNFLLNNHAVNGNVIFESEKLMAFAQSNWKDLNFDQNYDYPLALSLDLKVNKTKVDFANIVVKYGNTSGAGNLSFPLDGEDYAYDRGKLPERKKVEMAFNFTDLNLTPLVYTFAKEFKKYQDKDAVYAPDLDFDIIGDVKAVKSQYKDQVIKDLDLSFDVLNDDLTINHLTGVFPGDTSLDFKGELTSVEDEPNYDVEFTFNSNDFLKTLNWLGINPTLSAVSTYRKALGSANISGTMNKVQISPFSLTIDKSSVSGEAGVKIGERLDALLVLNADTINFDNYISQLPKEEQEKPFAQRMQYRFEKLGFLKDFELQIISKLGLGIYENMPFENVEFNATLLNGELDIEKLNIGSVANSKLDFSGKVKGFGGVPACENLKYAIMTHDVSALLNKFEFRAPDIDFKLLKDFESKGIITGSLDRFVTKSVSKLGNLDFVYDGLVQKKDDVFYYNGKIEAKHPDFVRMLNDFNLKYAPPAYALGLFNLESKFVGNGDRFRATELKTNVGFNEFSGDVDYDNTTGRPHILTNLNVNKFEIERFFYNHTGVPGKPLMIKPTEDEKSEFIAMPLWNRNKLNYDFYKKFDLTADLKFGILSYYGWQSEDTSFNLVLQDAEAKISKFAGKYHDGEVRGETELKMQGTPLLSGKLDFENIEINKGNWGGSKYGISGGKLSAQTNFNTTAESSEEAINNLNGNSSFDFHNTTIKGWNFAAIYDDITVREKADGLVMMVKNNLEQGNTPFNSIKGKVSFDKGAFSFSDMTMQGSNVNVDVYGDGSLPSWDMNWLFNVKYAEPTYLPGFSFSLKGKISNPVIDVDVSALYDMYNSRQQRIEDQIRAVEEAKIKRLNGLLEEQNKLAAAVYDDFKKTVLSEYDQKKLLADGDEIKNNYEKIGRQIDIADKNISETITMGMSPKYDDELIKTMAERNRKHTQLLEKIKEQIAINYLNDMREKVKNNHQKLTATLNEVNDAIGKYDKGRHSLEERLAAILTTYRLDNDGDVIAQKIVIEEKSGSLDTSKNEELGKYIQPFDSKDAEELRIYNERLQTVLAKAQNDVQVLNENIDILLKTGEEKVAAAEKAYQEKLREEEVQRKLEENTGTISIKKTGKSLTVRRDIDEIEKVEEEASKQGIKVLDFTAKKTGRVVSSLKPQEEETDIKPSGIVVKKSDEKKSATGGVVIRK